LPLIFRKTSSKWRRRWVKPRMCATRFFAISAAKNRARPSPPKLDRLLADVDPMIGQQILDVAVTEGRQLLLARKAGPRQTNDWVRNK
jgi:hypothetical protein